MIFEARTFHILFPLVIPSAEAQFVFVHVRSGEDGGREMSRRVDVRNISTGSLPRFLSSFLSEV